MTLLEFCKIYKGRRVDYDGAFGATCVDLARQYFQDVWGISRLAQPEGVVGAKDFFLFSKARPKQQKVITCNTVSPKIGDVVVFGETSANPYGHIAICVGVEDKYILTFEQDGYTQKGACFAFWPFDRYLGVLRKKNVV